MAERVEEKIEQSSGSSLIGRSHDLTQGTLV